MSRFHLFVSMRRSLWPGVNCPGLKIKPAADLSDRNQGQRHNICSHDMLLNERCKKPCLLGANDRFLWEHDESDQNR